MLKMVAQRCATLIQRQCPTLKQRTQRYQRCLKVAWTLVKAILN